MFNIDKLFFTINNARFTFIQCESFSKPDSLLSEPGGRKGPAGRLMRRQFCPSSSPLLKSNFSKICLTNRSFMMSNIANF